ncbi:hypothetical protein, partial [Vitiosangium sp. GDMCC 1.1324]|uniref:hypothetical protein n=1 Tax=Vitiosangium sp. (strain GDMCC 1.1324) TaxID=2138576 RepID=UPI000D4F4AA5
MHKQALLHAIDLHGDRVAAELAELRAHPPPLQVPVDVLERSGAEHLEALRAFRSSVQALAPADIPEALRSLYLSCRRGTCRGGIEVAEALDFIAAVGMPAVNVLLPEFGALEPHQQEDV